MKSLGMVINQVKCLMKQLTKTFESTSNLVNSLRTEYLNCWSFNYNDFLFDVGLWDSYYAFKQKQAVFNITYSEYLTHTEVPYQRLSILKMPGILKI